MTRTQGNNRALKDGRVVPRGFAFAFEEVDPLIAAFRRMVREAEFEICELALTTYVTARRYGARFTALPIFLVRGFHHGAIVCNTRLVRSPKDLEGKRVGVSRGYTVTTGVWARGILEREYGVDLDSIVWVCSGDEHVAQYRPPANVVRVDEGKTLEGMLIEGEIAAAVGIEVEHPDVAPLIPGGEEAGLRALREYDEFPINHLIVVRDDVLERDPSVPAEVFAAFVRAKRVYLDELRAGAIAKPSAADQTYRRVMEMTGDPLPYGVESNRRVLETLIAHAVSQHIIPAPVPLESLFVPSTLALEG